MSTFNAQAKAEYGGLLPPFDFTQRVSSHRGLQDKVGIVFEMGTVQGDLPFFFRHLGAPPRSHRGSDDEGFGSIFNRQQGQCPPYRAMKVRREVLAVGDQSIPSPVFKGALHIWPLSDATKVLKALLSLNPTEYLRRRGIPPHNRHLTGTLVRPFRPYLSPQFTRFTDPEFSLDGRDNWLPNTRGWRLATTEPSWQELLRSYISGVYDSVECDLERAGELANARLRRLETNRFAVRYVETYWEFFSVDPIGDVGRISPLMKDLFAAREEVYSAQDGSRAMSETLTFSYNTRCGERLKIYAKTNRRIRVEVSHQLSGEEIRFQQVPRYSFDSIPEVLGLLRTLAGHAAERVNQFFATLEQAVNFQHHKSPMQLLSEIALACRGDSEKAQTILNLLVFNTGIDKGRGSTIPAYLRSELRTLVERGILNSGKRFTASGPYREALGFLRQSENECVLRGRIRTKRSRFIP